MINLINRRSFLLTAGAAATVMAASGKSSAVAQSNTASAGNNRLAYRSVSELRGMLDGRQISAVELLDQAIKRIETQDARINAVVVRDFERALASATAADRALAQGERKLLLGIPVSVSKFLQHWRPADDVGTCPWGATGALRKTRLRSLA